MMAADQAAFDWASVRLVAFDVDGTLYAQRALRLRMAAEIVRHAAASRDLQFIAVLRAYRRIRERLAAEEVVDFEPGLIAETAAVTAQPPAHVRSLVAEWIEQRPLRHLARCRYPGLPDLFAGLGRSGRTIGIVSDYPARAKLNVLGLRADHVVAASDREVGVQKPHPRGLLTLMALAGATPQATVLIGDRIERDGMMARRAGARILIRSSAAVDGWPTFRRFDDALFRPITAAIAA